MAITISEQRLARFLPFLAGFEPVLGRGFWFY
jgi:hypothetical protein